MYIFTGPQALHITAASTLQTYSAPHRILGSSWFGLELYVFTFESSQFRMTPWDTLTIFLLSSSSSFFFGHATELVGS